MNFTNLKYSNVEHSVISAAVDGQKMSIPVGEGNTHYDEIVEQELEIAAYIEPEKSWEVQRREAYGSWQDQLDQMFHGTWEDHVAAVKAAHPKP